MRQTNQASSNRTDRLNSHTIHYSLMESTLVTPEYIWKTKEEHLRKEVKFRQVLAQVDIIQKVLTLQNVSAYKN